MYGQHLQKCEQVLLASGFKRLKDTDRTLYRRYFKGPILDLCFCALTAYWEKIYYIEKFGCLCMLLREQDYFFALCPMTKTDNGSFSSDSDFPSKEDFPSDGNVSLQESILKGIKFIVQVFNKMGVPVLFEYLSDKERELFEPVLSAQSKTALVTREAAVDISFDPRFSDCVLSREQLLHLSWKFKHKTADYNYFVRTYPDIEIKPFAPQNFHFFEQAMQTWCDGRECADCLFGCEKDVLKRFMQAYPANGSCGIAVTHNGRGIGCVIGELCGDYLYYCFGKSDKGYSGLSVYMYVELAKLFKAQWVNLGSDGGLEGLRRFKDKFAPYQRINKYTVKLTDITKAIKS